MPTGHYKRELRGTYTFTARRVPLHVIGPSIAYVPLNRGLFAIIDSEDIWRVSKWSWRATNSPHDTTTYATASEYLGGKTYRNIRLHRLLTAHVGITDHKDGDGLHCWKANLREADNSTNQFNSRKHEDNTSGYKGVNWHPQGWHARIMIKGKRKHLGFFKTPEEAGEAYRVAAIKMHGEFVHSSVTAS